MKIIKKKVNESLSPEDYQYLRLDKPMLGWQRQVYTLITTKLANSILDRMLIYVNRIVPEDASPKDVRLILIRSFMDYLDTVYENNGEE